MPNDASNDETQAVEAFNSLYQLWSSKPHDIFPDIWHGIMGDGIDLYRRVLMKFMDSSERKIFKNKHNYRQESVRK